MRVKQVHPEFKEGGALYGYNEDVTLTLAVIFILFIADHLLVRPFLNPKSRWFAVHAIGNAIVSIASFPEMIKTLKDPLGAFTGPMATMLPNSTVSAIHLYHCLFFQLRPDDWFHHMTSLPVTLFVALPFKQHSGAMNSFGTFFLCGLPGGLNYILLVLVKEGIVTALQQKALDAHINTWLRGPSMAVYAFIIYQAWIYDKYIHAPLPAFNNEGEVMLVASPVGSACFLVFVALLHFWNGQYYSKMAIGNYYSTAAKEALMGQQDHKNLKITRQMSDPGKKNS